MAELGKVDLACIGSMIVVVLASTGFLALFAGFVVIGDDLIWVGWIWWVVIAIVLASLGVIIVSSWRETGS